MEQEGALVLSGDREGHWCFMGVVGALILSGGNRRGHWCSLGKQEWALVLWGGGDAGIGAQRQDKDSTGAKWWNKGWGTVLVLSRGTKRALVLSGGTRGGTSDQ